MVYTRQTFVGGGGEPATPSNRQLAIMDKGIADLDQASGLYVGPAERSLQAMNWDPSLLGGFTAVPTAGRLELARVRLTSTVAVSNVCFYVSTVGSTLTSGQCFAALYTMAGSRIGVTADQAASWAGSTGLKAMALASGPFLCTAGDYYVGFFFNGTTGPTLTRGGASTGFNNLGLSSGSFVYCSADTGLTTTMPSSLGAQTAQGNPWWVGLS